MGDSDPVALFTHVISKLSARRIAYLHLIEPRSSASAMSDEVNQQAVDAGALFRGFDGPVIGAGGFSRATAETTIRAGKADAVAFGRLFISNPDLPERFRLDAPLNPYNRATFYGGSEEGYTDYPFAVAARA